jgi:hypothetical protein
MMRNGIEARQGRDAKQARCEARQSVIAQSPTPSPSFIRRGRNPDLSAPYRFEPVEKNGEFVEIVPEYAKWR